LLALLSLLNGPELEPLWQEDETIGWIYQYYNDPAERKKMREESAAPRNSRELAMRNQFFTPATWWNSSPTTPWAASGTR